MYIQISMRRFSSNNWKKDSQAVISNFLFTFPEEFCGRRRYFDLPESHPYWNLPEDQSPIGQLAIVPP